MCFLYEIKGEKTLAKAGGLYEGKLVSSQTGVIGNSEEGIKKIIQQLILRMC